MFYLRKLIAQPVGTCIYRNFTKHTNRTRDPGVARRKKLVSEDNEDADFEDLESDFMDVHKTHREHLAELQNLKERQKHLIVKQKYFKEQYPNFLTWHDKEQIRYLHSSDPEEWTVERLSEGFPALPHVIKKIVKSHYTKRTQNKITSHDESVQKNWKMFKDGQIPDLPKDLVEHLKKFTNRSLNFKPFVLPDSEKGLPEVKIQSTRTDFADIIKSYEKLKQPVLEIESKESPISQSKPAQSVSRKRPVTLSQLQANLSKKAQMGQEIDEIEKHMVSKVKSDEHRDNNLEVVNNEIQLSEDQRRERLVDLSPQKYPSTGVQNLQKTEKDLSHLSYPDRITIPKKVLKKGFIYKLNDCYYDDDGEFLYRVPGMY